MNRGQIEPKGEYININTYWAQSNRFLPCHQGSEAGQSSLKSITLANFGKLLPNVPQKLGVFDSKKFRQALGPFSIQFSCHSLHRTFAQQKRGTLHSFGKAH